MSSATIPTEPAERSEYFRALAHRSHAAQQTERERIVVELRPPTELSAAQRSTWRALWRELLSTPDDPVK